MRNNNLNNKSHSLKIFRPRDININNIKYNSYYDIITKKNNDLNLYNTISNQTKYSSFKRRELTLSSNYTSSYENIPINKNYQYSLNSNEFSNRYKYNDYNDIIPSINSNCSKNKTTNTFSIKRVKLDKHKVKINLINTEELTKISTLLSSFKSPKKKRKRKKYFNSSTKNFKYGSLLYHLNKKSKMNENDIQNRYRPIIKEFFGKKDYKKFASKSEKFVRPEELKMLYRDTGLINSIFDYLNNSFSKIRYHQTMINQKEKNELLKKKNEKNFCHKLVKEKDLPLNDIIQIKKIIYDKNKNKNKFKTINDEVEKESNILKKKIIVNKNLFLRRNEYRK